MNKKMTKQLVFDALKWLLKVVKRRKPSKGVIFHSDQASQYTSNDFHNTLLKYGMKSSISCKSDSWNNAVAEISFFLLEITLIYLNKYQYRSQTKQDIFEYIEIVYKKSFKILFRL